MNRLSFLGLTAIALASLASCQNNPSGYDEGAYDFAIKDTSEITSFVIWDNSPDTAVISRASGRWMVNDQYLARKEAADLLCETMLRMTLKNYPMETAVPNIMKQMAVYGKRVEVYAGDKLIKKFTIGTETKDMLGTYMLMDGYEQPVAMHMLGFNGYLSSRFFIREDLWRERSVFPSDEAIQSVQVTYPDSTYASFIVMKDGERMMTPMSWGQYNEMRGQSVFQAVRQVKYEGMLLETDPVWSKLDSIQSSIPVISVKVQYADGQTAELNCHHVPGGEDIIAADGTKLLWDTDRFYAFLPDGRAVLVQRYGLQHLLKTSRG